VSEPSELWREWLPRVEAEGGGRAAGAWSWCEQRIRVASSASVAAAASRACERMLCTQPQPRVSGMSTPCRADAMYSAAAEGVGNEYTL
jgi:hypothetical protein